MALAARRPVPRSLVSWRPSLRGLTGLVVALGGALALFVFYQAHQPQSVDVLRAARDVPAGAVLQAEDVQVVSEPLPAEISTTLVPAGERQLVVGRRIGQPLNTGELITRRRLEAPTRSIPAGQRVYTLYVNAEAVSAVNLQAGDQIEVAVVTDKNRPEQARTDVVLDRATVFSVNRPDSGSSPFAGGQRSGGSTGKTAALVVLVDDAHFQALTRAQAVGDLDFALLPQEAAR